MVTELHHSMCSPHMTGWHNMFTLVGAMWCGVDAALHLANDTDTGTGIAS